MALCSSALLELPPDYFNQSHWLPFCLCAFTIYCCGTLQSLRKKLGCHALAKEGALYLHTEKVRSSISVATKTRHLYDRFVESKLVGVVITCILFLLPGIFQIDGRPEFHNLSRAARLPPTHGRRCALPHTTNVRRTKLQLRGIRHSHIRIISRPSFVEHCPSLDHNFLQNIDSAHYSSFCLDLISTFH